MRHFRRRGRSIETGHCSKRVSGKWAKTDADFEELVRLEFFGGFYLHIQEAVIPGKVIERPCRRLPRRFAKVSKRKPGSCRSAIFQSNMVARARQSSCGLMSGSAWL
jgi:hypothetical protein